MIQTGGVTHRIVFIISIMHFSMASLAYRDKPFNGLPSYVIFRISLVMNLSGGLSTIHTSPIVPFKYYIAFSSPFLRLEVLVAIIVPSTITINFGYPACQYH